MSWANSPLLVEFEHCHKSILRNLDRTEIAHSLFTFLLLFKQLFLTRYIAAVALCKNVLAKCLYGFARYDLASDCRLNRDLEELARDMLFELFGKAART